MKIQQENNEEISEYKYCLSDHYICSIKKDNKHFGILLKFPKKKQDIRADLPTIGIDTLKDCKKIGLKGVVLKSKKNIFLDRNKCISFANKNKIFIKVI